MFVKLLLGLGVLFGFWLGYQLIVGQPAERATITKQRAHLRVIGQALEVYSHDHGGLLPEKLEDATGDPHIKGSWPLHLFDPPDGSPPTPWVFKMPGAKRDELSRDSVVVESTVFSQNGSTRKLVLLGDFSVEMMPINQHPASHPATKDQDQKE